MSGKPLDGDTRVSVIQCHRLGLQTKDIVTETGVSEQNVSRLVAKFKASLSAQTRTPGKCCQTNENQLHFAQSHETVRGCHSHPYNTLSEVSLIFVGLLTHLPRVRV